MDFNFSVPALRQDLKVYKGGFEKDGSPTWMLYDPISDNYFKLGWFEFECLQRIEKYKNINTLVASITKETTLEVDEEDIRDFVTFLISPIEGLGHGTLIENTADIFFDFNDPIITNTTSSFITFPENKQGVDEDKLIVNILQNPTQDFLKVETPLRDPITNLEYKIFDNVGRLVFSGIFNISKTIDISSLRNGLYYLSVNYKEKNVAKKFIKL